MSPIENTQTSSADAIPGLPVTLKRMRPMRSERELQLYERFMSVKPAASKLEFTRSIEAESTLDPPGRARGTSNGLACERRRLVLLAPDELAARDKRFVDGTLQWLPMIGCVEAVKLRDEVAAEQVVPSRIGNPQVKIAVISQVPIST